jgi:ADP-ribosylglycohydrolase
MHDYRDALTAAIDAARAAGAILLEGLGQLERADEFTARAEAVVRERLRAVNGWSYSSTEEPLLNGDDPSHHWVVNVNDGAAHYAKGWRGSAVVIAVERRTAEPSEKPLVVVYAFAYPDHEGDLIAWAEGCGPITRNGRTVDAFVVDIPLDAQAVSFDDRLIVYVPPEFDDHPHATGQRVAPARYIPLPSLAYRVALVAVGEGIGSLSVQESDAPCFAMREALTALVRFSGGSGVTSSHLGELSPRHFDGGPMTVSALRQRPWHEPPTPAPADPGPALLRPARYPPARLSGRVIADSGVLARAQGCLLGQSAGDALGGLVEFEDTETINKRYPHGCRDLLDGGTWNNLAGQPTDDTELALLLARSIVHMGRYDREEVLKAYLDWWNDPRTYDRGSTIGKALSAAARGTSPEDRLLLIEQFANKGSQANGSLMRISPVGVYAAGRPDLAAEIALHESRLTHPHPVCGQSCAVYSAAIAHSIATGCGPRGAYEEALRQADRLAYASVREALIRAETAPPEDYYTNQGWVLIALQNAFYQLLNAPTLEEGIVATVMSGGDTDTTGAIAGALLGAVHGRGAIPPRWLRTILCCRMHAGTPTDHKRAREYWPCDVLELAELLLLAGR